MSHLTHGAGVVHKYEGVDIIICTCKYCETQIFQDHLRYILKVVARSHILLLPTLPPCYTTSRPRGMRQARHWRGKQMPRSCLKLQVFCSLCHQLSATWRTSGHPRVYIPVYVIHKFIALTHKGMADTQYTNYNHTFNSLDKQWGGKQSVSMHVGNGTEGATHPTMNQGIRLITEQTTRTPVFI